MMKIFAGKLIDEHNLLATLGQALIDNRAFGRALRLAPADITDMRRRAKGIKEHCEDLGAMASAAVAGEVDALLAAVEASDPQPNGDFVISISDSIPLEARITEMTNMLKREFQTRLMLAVSPGMDRFFEPSVPLFGSAVGVKFPSITYDLSEGGKCMALGRSTAAVFHLLRCLEAGIRAIARCLAIPDPTTGYGRNWGQILKDVKAAMDGRWPNNASRMAGDGKLFEALYGSLAAIKSPYRDTTMHLDEKYTEDEARYIFEMVKGLMIQIAERMDENGEPKA